MKPVLISGGASFFGKRLLFIFFYYIQVTIRLFRLHVLGQRGRPREKPKVALYRDRGVALIQSFIHLVPLTVVIVFMVLNIRSWYWGDPSTTVLTALQFAAKALEILMQTSLGTALMSIVRHQLLGERGLPLGSFLSPYSVTDISFLWSVEFWGGITSKYARVRQRLYLGVIIAALVVLASLVGPSIAVLLIPRPIDYTGSNYLIMLDDQGTIFPSSVDLKGVNLTNEDAFREVLLQTAQNEDRFIQFTDEYDLRRTIVYSADLPAFFPQPDPITGIGTIPPTLLSQALSFPALLFMQGLRFTIYPPDCCAKTTTFQPYVQENCLNQYLDDTQDPESTFVTFGDISPEATNLTFANLIETIKASTPENATTNSMIITWSESPHQAPNHSILKVEGSLLENGEANHENAVVKATGCVIDAIWATTKLNLTRDSDSQSVVNFELGSNSSQESKSQLIRISPDWAARVLDVYVEYQPDVTKMPLAKVFALALAGVAPIPDIAFGPYGWKRAHTDPMLEGSEVEAVSLSQAQYDAASNYFQANKDILSKHTDIIFYAAANWTDPNTLYHYEFETYRQGYGYDSSSVPVLLSLIVVGVYSLVAVTHLLYTFITGYVGKSWDTIAELLLLGLHSQPPAVDAAANTTVGIETLGPFEENVSVRINEQGKAELLFDRDTLNKRSALRKVEINEAY